MNFIFKIHINFIDFRFASFISFSPFSFIILFPDKANVFKREFITADIIVEYHICGILNIKSYFPFSS